MNLYFLRHAKAFERGPKFRPDSKRPLTPEGEKKMYRVAKGIRNLGEPLDLILCSPYARAFRTAEILAEVQGCKKMFATKNLAAEEAPKNLIDEINARFSSVQNIVLVGHEPYLSGLISLLLTGDNTMQLVMKKAGFCKLVVPEGLRFDKCASLNWLLTPGQLAALKR